MQNRQSKRIGELKNRFFCYTPQFLFRVLLIFMIYTSISQETQASDANPFAHIAGGNYGPFRNGQNPNQGIFPTPQEIRADLAFIKREEIANVIRSYSVTNGLDQIVTIAKDEKLSVVPGAWISGNSTADALEITQLQHLAQDPAASSYIPFVVVGSEALFRGDVTVFSLIEKIKRIQATVSVPVATAELWHIWLANPNLMEAVDIIFVNIFPYWEKIPIEEAVDFVLNRLQAIKIQAQGKPVIISETGWPSEGLPNGPAVPSVINQEKFLQEFLNATRKKEIDFFIFELFNEAWKLQEPNGVGPHWGLYYSDRTPKHSITSLITQPKPSGRHQDFDGNGTADLLWRNSTSGQVAIWLMEGAAVTSTGFLVGVPKEWQIAGVGDVDADGKADVIWHNTSSGTVAVWLMNGLTITSTGFPGSASTDWNIQKVGDVDGDGKADLIWRDTNGGGVAIWLMNGVAIASTGFPGVVPAAWQIAQVDDVDGNQSGDVIWRNSTNGMVAVWLMDGLTISSVGFPGSVPSDWEIQGAGDMNGNGTADILWRNNISGQVAIWLMEGAMIASSGFLVGVPTEWQIAGVGDVDADGKADVIWRKTTTGTVAVWMMNGLTITSVGFLGSTSTDWEIQ